MAGLIVTCARHFEPDACDEIEKILADLGDESAYAKATSMSGIITVETSLDPENAINDVRALIDDEPWVVRYLMRLIPITKWIESKQDQIVSNVQGDYCLVFERATSYSIDGISWKDYHAS